MLTKGNLDEEIKEFLENNIREIEELEGDKGDILICIIEWILIYPK